MSKQNLPTTWEAAAQLMGLDPNVLPDVSMIADRFRNYNVGMYKRAVVVEALNKAFGDEGEERWIPNYDNGKWDKNYPWGVPGPDAVVPSGFGFSGTSSDHSYTATNVGSRLELRDPKLVYHMLDTPEYRQILVDTMTIPPGEK